MKPKDVNTDDLNEEKLQEIFRKKYLALETIEQIDDHLKDKSERYFSTPNEKLKKILMDAIDILLDQRLYKMKLDQLVKEMD